MRCIAKIIMNLALKLLLCSTILEIGVFATSKLAKEFADQKIVPDVIPKAPDALVSIKYTNGTEVKEGNELTPSQVQIAPTVCWKSCNESFYTLVMTDPDAPSRQNPTIREYLHWLIVNIPGVNLSSGEALAEYRPSAPPVDSGIHRYTFLVYKQPSKLTFEEPRINKTTIEGRKSFSIAKFAIKHNLGDPVAGNFFLAQHEQ